MGRAPVRIRHKATQLWMHIEEGNDLWSRDLEEAAEFPTKAKAIEVAKRFSLRSNEYEIV